MAVKTRTIASMLVLVFLAEMAPARPLIEIINFKDDIDMNDSTSFHQCSGGRKRGEHGHSAGSAPVNHFD